MELFIDLVQIYSGTNPNDQCYDAPATHYVWTRLLTALDRAVKARIMRILI